ncbi:MAG: AraC family transcriptional regulator [Lachnospiraceae bacterium]
MNKVDFQVYNECKGSHSHELYSQIMIPLKKTLGISIGDMIYEVQPLGVCYIPPRMLHQCQFFGDLLVINIPRDMIDKKDTGIMSYPMIIQMQSQIMELVRLIRNEIECNPEGKAVYHLYNYLYSKLIENSHTASVRYISQHYDQPITVTELAKLENYNPTYFNDWFKMQTGFSPSDYLRHVRISKAKELLETTNYTIMEVAIMVGYSSNSTLTRAFHEITGTTPKKYRAELTLCKTG